MKTLSSVARMVGMPTLLACLALGPPITVLGQGIIHVNSGVYFQNSEAAGVGHLVTNFDNTLLVGTQYKAELYYLDTATSTLTPLPASLSSFKSTTSAVGKGTWNGPPPSIALPAGYGGVDVVDDGSGIGTFVEAGDGSGTGPGYYPVTLRVRAWDSTTGSSWEAATQRGESPLFSYTQRYSHEPPSITDRSMVNQPGFQLGSSGPVAPGISTQPQGQSGYWGKTASFKVTVYGTAPLGYQWFKDGAEIPGATQFTLNLTNLDLSAGGNYTVVISNSVGSVTSNPAFLLLNAAGISLGLYPGLTIDGVVGNTYGIQYTTNLVQSSSWTTVTNLTLTQPVQLWLDTSPDAMVGTAPHRSYRVVAGP